jgi:hypothetical protein
MAAKMTLSPRFHIRSGVLCAVILSTGLICPLSNTFGQDGKERQPASIDPQHPLAPALEQAYKAREALAGVKDYTAVFSKQELVGNDIKRASMTIKFREEPFSVYMLFGKPYEGREVIYVAGANNNLLLAHDTGVRAVLGGTVSLAPESERAMEDNRYPITMIGLKNMLDRIISQWEAEGQYGETNVRYFPNATLGKDVACRVIESSHPQPRKQFKFQMTRLYIDKQTGIAIRVEQYGFPKNGEKAPLVEEYTYMSVKTNVGLTARDFDAKNSSYAFP